VVPVVGLTQSAQTLAAPAQDSTTPLVNPYTGWLIDGSAQDARGTYFPMPSRTTAFADDAPNYGMVMDTLAWADLQPTSPSSFDFSEIDNVIAYWKPRGKKVVVKIISTDDPGWLGPGREVRPSWLINDPSVTWKAYSYGGYNHFEPAYQDSVHFPTFMAKWTNLMNHVAAHYSGSKDVVGFLVGWGNWGEYGNTIASKTDLGIAGRQSISAGFANAAKNAFANTGIPVVTYAFYLGAGTLNYADQSNSITFDTGPDALEGIASGGYDGGTTTYKQSLPWTLAIYNHWYSFQNFGEADYTPGDGTQWTNAIAGNGYVNEFISTHVDYAQLWMNSKYYNDPTVNNATVKANISAGIVGGGLGCRLAVSAADLTAGILHVAFVNQNVGTCFQNPPVYVYVNGVKNLMLPSVAGKDLSKLERTMTECGDTKYCATSVTYQIASNSLPAFVATDHAYVAVGDEGVSERLWLGNRLPTDATGAAITTGLGTDVTKRAIVRYDLGPLGIAGGNGGGDSTPPAVSLAAPTAGSTVSGTTVTVSATASDDVAVAGVQFKLDGGNLGAEVTSLPYTISWDSTSTSNGPHTLSAVARDAAGNTATATGVNVTVNNQTSDTTPPAVSLSAPAAGATVSGTTTVSASASDNVGVVGVQFKLDGANLGGEDTSAPYSVSWDTTSASNGGHSLTALARDAANNQATTAAVSVTVANGAPAGLVACYSFNAGSGTIVADISGNGNTGTISNTTWSTAGKFGGALSFNGSNSWVTVPDANSLDLTRMTLEAWVRPSSLSAWRDVLIKEQTGELVYALYANNPADRPSGIVYIGGELKADGTAKLPLNTWTHLATTYDGSTLRLYVNGTQVSSRAVTGSMPASTGALRIGGDSLWGEYFNGLIDEVRIYNRALSATEIQTDMNTALSP
jgi:hypothetical protein